MSLVEDTKALLGDPANRIRLHDLVVGAVTDLLAATTEQLFPVSGKWSADEFKERLTRYEGATADLRAVMALLAYWGEPHHGQTLTLPVRRLAARTGEKSSGGIWVGLGWYPALLLVYAAGIAGVAAGKYGNLSTLLGTAVPLPARPGARGAFVLTLISGLSDNGDAFKSLPDYERRYTPRSDYLFKLMRAEFEGVLMAGMDYEACFDRWEVMLALEHAYRNSVEAGRQPWGPPGSFAWKQFHREKDAPLAQVISEAEAQGGSWQPIEAGFFGGSIERFRETASAYQRWVNGLGWH